MMHATEWIKIALIFTLRINLPNLVHQRHLRLNIVLDCQGKPLWKNVNLSCNEIFFTLLPAHHFHEIHIIIYFKGPRTMDFYTMKIHARTLHAKLQRFVVKTFL